MNHPGQSVKAAQIGSQRPRRGRSRATRPPFAYFGGKQTIAARIAAMLPDHAHYVEPFAGSLAVLLAKPPSRMETVNDLDRDLMTFWRVLRDRPTELIRACALTPHSRAGYAADAAGLADDQADDDLERARRVWSCIAQGRTGVMRRNGWRHYVNPGGSSASMPGYLAGYVDRMAAAAERLASVSLECRPALDVIATYGAHRSCLLYCDPPYLAATGRSSNYRHEMGSERAHRDLAEALARARATVVLSGYTHPLYDRELYRDWHRYEIPTATAQGGTWATRTEVLWSNRPLQPVAIDDLFTGNETQAGDPAEAGPRNETQCVECGATIRQAATGRPRRYCSPACRVRAHRRARAAGGESLAHLAARADAERTDAGA